MYDGYGIQNHTNAIIPIQINAKDLKFHDDNDILLECSNNLISTC